MVQSNATIVAAAGAGINAYNYGAGNVTVITTATSSTTGAHPTGTQADGINANANDGGNVSITNGGSVTGGTGIFSSTVHAGSIHAGERWPYHRDGLVRHQPLAERERCDRLGHHHQHRDGDRRRDSFAIQRHGKSQRHDNDQ